MAQRRHPRLRALGLLFVCFLSAGRGEGLLKPKWVKFKLDFFPHILEWEPGHSEMAGDFYKVEYRKYGDGDRWKSAVHCTQVTGRTCDLTVETLAISKGYFARVQAVSGNQTSNWTRTSRFIPQQVRLPPPDVDLKLEGNTIHVALRLPALQWQNVTLRYEDIFKFNRAYRVYINRTSDNLLFTQNEESTEFDVSNLAWGEQYCITVTPEIRSRPNLGITTEAHCASVPAEARTGVIVLTAFSCITVLCMLLVFGNIFVCLYIKKPMKTPEMLKSPIKASSLWMEKWQPPSWIEDVVVSLDEESIKKLSMLQKSSPVRLSTDSGFCGDKISLESESRSPTPSLGCPDQSPVVPRPLKVSWTGTDSGICVSGTTSKSSELACTESQGYRKQRNENECGLDLVNAASHVYLKQSKLKDDPSQNEVMCEGPDVQGISSLLDTFQRTMQLEAELCKTDLPPLAEVNGYLKQSAKQCISFSYLRETLGQTHISLLGERGQASSLVCSELKGPGLVHTVLSDLVTEEDFGKDLIAEKHIPGRFITDIDVVFPLASSLRTQDGFHLEFNTLSLVDVDIKDR
ncbi:interleukin-10 receptor subunit alpha [Lissotriton helveticus]